MIDHNKKVIDGKMNLDETDIDIAKNNSTTNSRKRKTVSNVSLPKKKGKTDKNLYKQPTVAELNQLRETENLFHSNLLRLQIEEVLKSVKIKDKYKILFEDWFKKFKNLVNSLDKIKEIELENDCISRKYDVKIPMKKSTNGYHGTLRFLPPSNIIIGGSYLLDTAIGPNASIDVLVEIPKNVFQKVDCKNYRYMRKKMLYLAVIASSIDEELAQSKCFIGSHSNSILKIVPAGKLSKYITVHIHLVAQETSFQMNKFTAEKNNVKSHWYFKNNENCDINAPTPFYNNIITHDLTTLRANVESAKVLKEYSNIRDGIILLKIWLKQRELGNNLESFNSYIITMYVLYLLHIKKLNTFMSSYQVTRNTWQHLATNKWYENGISFCQDEKIQERISLYHRFYDCVFLDETGFHNIAAHVSTENFKWISNQANMAIECLNNTRINSFQILFMRKVPFYSTFDHILCIHNIKAVRNIVDAKSTETDKLNYGFNKYVQAVKFITSTLKQGLSNRISLINVLPRKMLEWNVNDDIPDDFERIYVGLQLDPNFASNIIEKGPSANLPEAEEFRKFWGNKSELRRFKDGTICEAIVWTKENATLAEKREITEKITKYLLEEKLKLFEKSHYFVVSNQMEDMLKLKKIAVTNFRYGTEEAALRAIMVFDSLEKELSNLSELPLPIHGVQGCSPLFRYAQVFPPLASIRRPDKKNVVNGKSHVIFKQASAVEEVPAYLAPIEATFDLSMSGKWPDDLEALRMTKAAFYLQIADCLRKQYKLRAHGSFHHIDIMKDGLVFRLRLALQKEIGLVKQQKDENGIIKYRDNEESIELEKNLFHLPKITGALYGLHCQQPSFGPACCLTKRWLSAQLIDDSHMPDIVVELLLASMYLNTDPYMPAQTPQLAFIRFLQCFANEYWTTDPIIVNFNNELTHEEMIEIENLFGTSEKTLPPLFISTPYDKQTSIWTRKAPSTLVLKRISSLAKECLRLIETQLFGAVNLCYEPLFVPLLSEYDCVIRLKDSFNSRRFEATAIGENPVQNTLHPFKEHSNMKIPIVGFDPVAEYLKELRNSYTEYALFFHDTYGGSVIGVLLKPQALEKKDFKVTVVSCQKFDSNNKLILNISAMIEDFYILGKGLVENIDIQSKKINAI